jgi:hypothetical protein
MRLLDLQQNTGRGPRRRGTGQIFKQHVGVAHYSIQKGKDNLALNAFIAAGRLVPLYRNGGLSSRSSSYQGVTYLAIRP